MKNVREPIKYFYVIIFNIYKSCQIGLFDLVKYEKFSLHLCLYNENSFTQMVLIILNLHLIVNIMDAYISIG